MTTTPDPLRPADDDERRLLHETFAALCAVRSPTGHERACADLAAGWLRAEGLEVVEDDAGERTGGTAGNLLVRIPSTSDLARRSADVASDPPASPPTTALTEPPVVLLCAHLDTVAVDEEIRPVLDDDGVWRDALGGVLGADDKAAVAAMLLVARRLAREPAPVGLELLLTVAEEEQLRGIAAFDASTLRARSGYVVDHPTPIGGIVVGAPGHVRFDATFTGRAAHAAIAPEQGRSALLAAARAAVALPCGALPDGSTVNVGALAAGTRPVETPGGPVHHADPPTNVVPAHAQLVGELRAPSEAALAALVDRIEAILHDAAHDPAGPVDLDLVLERRFSPYAHPQSGRLVTRARAALTAIGVDPRPFADAGGSDANVLNARGVPTLVLAGGNAGAHERGESIAAAELERTLDLLLAVLREEAAAA